MNISEKLKLKDGLILIISNYGDYIIYASEWDTFQENMQVSYGEYGKHFKTLLVIDEFSRKFDHTTADRYFSLKGVGKQ